MDTEPKSSIIAVITMKQEDITGSGATIFAVDNLESLQSTSSRLEKILDASAHEVDEHTMIIVAR